MPKLTIAEAWPSLKEGLKEWIAGFRYTHDNLAYLRRTYAEIYEKSLERQRQISEGKPFQLNERNKVV